MTEAGKYRVRLEQIIVDYRGVEGPIYCCDTEVVWEATHQPSPDEMNAARAAAIGLSVEKNTRGADVVVTAEDVVLQRQRRKVTMLGRSFSLGWNEVSRDSIKRTDRKVKI